MRTLSFFTLLRHGLPLVLVSLLAAGSAGAQCTISGPTTLCGGSTTLCGPEGPYEYMWSGPGGANPGNQRCWVVGTPGTYQLTTFDFINGLWAGPCEVVVTAGGASTCAISGASSGCAGGPLPLCGPEGSAEFEWSGPGGFSSAARCIDAVAAGDYRLRTRAVAGGCWSDPCQTSVVFTDCRPPVESCPLTAHEWSMQCRSRKGRVFDAVQMAQIAKSVATRSKLFAGDSRSLCRTLDNRCNLEARARRQLAAVLANISAHELGLIPGWGPARGLDPEAQVTLSDFTGTVEAWVRMAEGRLSAADSKRHRHRGVKEGFRAVIAGGWRINHGIGIDVACAGDPKKSGLGATAAEDEATEETLASEMADDLDRLLSLESLEPNPTAGATRIVYSIASSENADVSLGVYDISGRLVRHLVQGSQVPGRHQATWDGRDASGRAVTNGAYFVVGRIGAEKFAARLVLVR